MLIISSLDILRPGMPRQRRKVPGMVPESVHGSFHAALLLSLPLHRNMFRCSFNTITHDGASACNSARNFHYNGIILSSVFSSLHDDCMAKNKNKKKLSKISPWRIRHTNPKIENRKFLESHFLPPKYC